MYMSTRANFDYWSTDNCCVRWSLRTGACTIGAISLVWQSAMMSAGILMLVQCPIEQDANLTSPSEANLTTSNSEGNLTSLSEANLTSLPEANLTSLPEANLTSLPVDMNLTYLSEAKPTSLTPTASQEIVGNSGCFSPTENNTGASSQLISRDNSSSNSSASFRCPWLPEPETEILGVKDEGTLKLVAGIFVAYSSIYSILSFSVILGTIKKSPLLLQGWVAFTSIHNMLILAFLLVPLPFTTLPHLLFSITHFVLSLYMWAVVKSYMHALKVEKKKALLPDDAITDFSVDGVDVTEIPVEV